MDDLITWKDIVESINRAHNLVSKEKNEPLIVSKKQYEIFKNHFKGLDFKIDQRFEEYYLKELEKEAIRLSEEYLEESK